MSLSSLSSSSISTSTLNDSHDENGSVDENGSDDDSKDLHPWFLFLSGGNEEERGRRRKWDLCGGGGGGLERVVAVGEKERRLRRDGEAIELDGFLD